MMFFLGPSESSCRRDALGYCQEEGQGRGSQDPGRCRCALRPGTTGTLISFSPAVSHQGWFLILRGEVSLISFAVWPQRQNHQSLFVERMCQEI